MPKIGIFVHFGSGLADSLGALLVDWLVVVARGLYFARHLFTLCFTNLSIKTYVNEWLEEECALCFYLATADAKLPTLPIISEGNQEIQSCQFIF